MSLPLPIEKVVAGNGRRQMSSALNPTRQSTENGLNCAKCGKSFRNSRILNAHLLHTHHISIPQAEPVVKKKFHMVPVRNTSKLIPDFDYKTHSVTIFKCPHCGLMYSYYVKMLRHMQTAHPAVSGGRKSRKETVLQPIKMIICEKCRVEVSEGEKHVCKTAAHPPPEYGQKIQSFQCGCGRSYQSRVDFDGHIPEHHGLSMDSLFFKELDYFLWWKRDMTKKTRCSYMKQAHNSLRQQWNCAFKDPITRGRCPSALFVYFLGRGVQVNFFKDHIGHGHVAYQAKRCLGSFSLESVRHIVRETSFLQDGAGDSHLRWQVAALLKHAADFAQGGSHLDMPILRALYTKSLEIIATLNEQAYPLEELNLQMSRKMARHHKRKNIDNLGLVAPSKYRKHNTLDSDTESAQSTSEKEDPSVKIGRVFSLSKKAIEKETIIIEDDLPCVKKEVPQLLNIKDFSKIKEIEVEMLKGLSKKEKISKPIDVNAKIIKEVSMEEKEIKPIDIEEELLKNITVNNTQNGKSSSFSPKVTTSEPVRPPAAAARPAASSYVDTFKDFLEKSNTMIMDPVTKICKPCPRTAPIVAPYIKPSKIANVSSENHNKNLRNFKKNPSEFRAMIKRTTRQEIVREPEPEPYIDLDNVVTKEEAAAEEAIAPHNHTVEIKIEPEAEENITIEENNIGVKFEQYEVLEQENDCNILVFKI